MLGLVLLLIVAIVVLPRIIHVVPPDSEAIVERMGRFQRVLRPGLHLSLIPFVDRVARTVPLQPRVLTIPAITEPAQDALPLTVASELSYQVTDSQKLHLSLQDYEQALVSLAHTAIRDTLKNCLWDEVAVDRKPLVNSVLRRIEDGARNWGIRATDFTLLALTPPAEVLRALEEQAKREREQRS